MDGPDRISIDVTYDNNGFLIESKLIMAIEEALGGRLRITDWISERMISEEYDLTNKEDIRNFVNNISVGDYDDAIDQDIRREVLDQAFSDAGLDQEEVNPSV